MDLQRRREDSYENDEEWKEGFGSLQEWWMDSNLMWTCIRLDLVSLILICCESKIQAEEGVEGQEEGYVWEGHAGVTGEGADDGQGWK